MILSQYAQTASTEALGLAKTIRVMIFLVGGLVAAHPSTSLAIRPDMWIHTTEQDFSSGKTVQVAITNLGDLKLATATATVAEMPEQATIIFDLHRTKNGELYLATGPKGKLLRHTADKINEVLSLREEQIFSLDTFDGQLLAGVSGDKTSRLAVLDNGKLKPIAALPNARYIWDIVVTHKKIYVATGTEGKLYEIDAVGDGEPKVTILLDAEQDNLLCLGRDGKGRLYAGSDGEGLVYRVTFDKDSKPSSFVQYDAAEPEIGALLVQADGTVFAGTADAKQAKPGRLTPAVKELTGRPKTAEPAGGKVKFQAAKRVPKTAPTKPDASKSTLTAKEVSSPQTTRTTKDSDEPKTKQKKKEQDEEPSRQPNAHIEHPPLIGVETVGDVGPDRLLPTAEGQATKEQLDELRRVMRQRLEAAKETGELQPSSHTEAPLARAPRHPPPTLSSTVRAKPRKPSKKGNAIYKISPDGFVQEIFRESVMILRIIEDQGRLLVGTGNDGQIYQVDVVAEETAILVDLEAQQAPAMVSGGNNVFLGTANPASLLRIGDAYAGKGTFTSKVLDAKQVSLWGRLNLRAQTPPGTSVMVETRCGNVEDPTQAAWFKWSPTVVLEGTSEQSRLTPRELEVNSPPARFFQYRITLESDGKSTSVVNQLQLAYVTPNLRPKIESITTKYGSGTTKIGSVPRLTSGSAATPKHETDLRIEWKASDPNKDRLHYTLEYRPESSDRWLLLAEDLTTTRFQWKTQRVPDGRYVLRITTSDRADNPPDMERRASRHSDPILIDNMAPRAEDLRHQVMGNSVSITGVAVDAHSTIRRIDYLLDAEDPWEPVLSKDLIYDSTREAFVIKIGNLEAGPHVIAIRIMDNLNNAQYEQLLVQVQ